MPMAVVIDGAYFLRRFGHCFPSLDSSKPGDLAKGVLALATFHLSARLSGAYNNYPAAESIARSWPESQDLYRIFFYDCPPLTKRLHKPISGRSMTLGDTPSAKLRIQLHETLNDTRKVALRLGKLNDQFSGWRPKPDSVQRWLADTANFTPEDDDFEINTIQKGVDMRLGLDVASMAFKKQVDQIILVAGDADFVPAVKLARREGIDVVLDPMWGKAAADLVQHVDGLQSCLVTAEMIERA
jgi:uncharacterized LabA/DUF88 family protein